MAVSHTVYVCEAAFLYGLFLYAERRIKSLHAKRGIKSLHAECGIKSLHAECGIKSLHAERGIESLREKRGIESLREKRGIKSLHIKCRIKFSVGVTDDIGIASLGTEGNAMEDAQIIELYWERSQQAIVETKTKYSRLIFSIAMKILRVMEDASECENDTYLRTWNSIPPQRPDLLSAYLGRITRNLALDRFEREHAQKRGGSQIPLILDELEECIASSQGELSFEMRDLLNRFLEGQPERSRKIFLRRYWFGDSVKEIAQKYDIGESLVKMTLLRSRNALRTLLEQEGVSI